MKQNKYNFTIFYQDDIIRQGQTLAKKERQLRSAQDTATGGVPAIPIKPSVKVRYTLMHILTRVSFKDAFMCSCM